MLWFFESKHHLLESIAKIAHFYIMILLGGGGGGCYFDEKIPPKNNFFKGCGEKMAITWLILGLAPSKLLALDREQDFG